MAISNFQVVAYPKFTASGSEDLDDHGEPRLDTDQQCQLDQAQRMVKHCADVMSLLEDLAMSNHTSATRAMELLSHIRHGI